MAPIRLQPRLVLPRVQARGSKAPEMSIAVKPKRNGRPVLHNGDRKPLRFRGRE